MNHTVFLYARHGLALLALLVATQPANAQKWVQWSAAAGGNNHYFALTLGPTNWTDAQKQAVSWGGHLATITSAKEQEFISQTFLVGEFEHCPLWIGLFDPPKSQGFSAKIGSVEIKIGGQPKAPHFQWVTDEPLSYSNWSPGQPDNCPPGENYVAINWHNSDAPPRGTKGDWNDAPLNGTTGWKGQTTGPYYGIVERDINPSLPIPRKLPMPEFYISLLIVVIVGVAIAFARFSRRKGSPA